MQTIDSEETKRLAAAAHAVFHAPFYIRHNQRRLEHLASLGLDLIGKSVLEPGAGIGDHTLFYLDRGCNVTALEPRPENCAAFRLNISGARTPHADRATLIEGDVWAIERLLDTFDVVHCYGLLYHLDDPKRAVAALAARTHGILLLETCASPGDEVAINRVSEPSGNVSQASTGTGCRPTRRWLAEELTAHFPYVYAPVTRPFHNEFPSDWTHLKPGGVWDLTRAIFIASRKPLALPSLSTDLLKATFG
jgi:SAM-dependent methyltransferase